VIDPFLLLKNLTWSPDTRVPKPVPVSVMTVPVGPQVFDSDDRYGPVVTVSVTPLLACPLVVTTTGPLVAPAGTTALRLTAPQPITDAGTPLTVSVLVPCAAPKPRPPTVAHRHQRRQVDRGAAQERRRGRDRRLRAGGGRIRKGKDGQQREKRASRSLDGHRAVAAAPRARRRGGPPAGSPLWSPSSVRSR
jgi:hypothetical protein